MRRIVYGWNQAHKHDQQARNDRRSAGLGLTSRNFIDNLALRVVLAFN